MAWCARSAPLRDRSRASCACHCSVQTLTLPGRRFAETLERCAAPPAVIDAARPAEHVREPFAVDPAGPAGMAGEVVLLRPLSLQERLGPAVAHLLFPERPQRVTAMVPDHGRRAEPQRLAAFPKPPAQVDVVSGDTELGIETADRLEGGLAHGHV